MVESMVERKVAKMVASMDEMKVGKRAVERVA